MSKKDKNTVSVEIPGHDFGMVLRDSQRYISMSDLFSFFTKLAEEIDTTEGASPYVSITVRAVRDYLDKLGLEELE